MAIRQATPPTPSRPSTLRPDTIKRAVARLLRILVGPPNAFPALEDPGRIILVLDTEKPVVRSAVVLVPPVGVERVALVTVRAAARSQRHQLGRLPLHVPDDGEALIESAVPRPGGGIAVLPQGRPPRRLYGRAIGGGAVHVGPDDRHIRQAAGVDDVAEVALEAGGEGGRGKHRRRHQARVEDVERADAEGAAEHVLLEEGVEAGCDADVGRAAVLLGEPDDAVHGLPRAGEALDRGRQVDDAVAVDVAAPSVARQVQRRVDQRLHEAVDVVPVAGVDGHRGHGHGRPRLHAVRRVDDEAEGAAAAAAQGPEEIGVHAAAGDAEAAVGRDDGELHDAVCAEPQRRAHDGVAAVLHPAARHADGGRVRAQHGGVVLVSKGVCLAAVDAGAGRDGVVRVAGRASLGDELVVADQRLQPPRPEHQRPLLARVLLEAVPAVLDDQPPAASAGVPERLDGVVGVPDLDVVRRHVALVAADAAVCRLVPRVACV